MTENHMPIGRETLLLPKPDKISSNVMFQPPKTGMLVYMCRYTYIYIYIYIGSLTLIITPLQNDDDIYFPPFELTLVTYICRIGFKNLNKDSITQTWQVNAHIGSSNSPADLPRIFCTHICLIFCTYMQKLTQAHKLVTPLYAYEN